MTQKDTPIKWSLTTRHIDNLTPHPRNPRSLSFHDSAHLKTSLEKYGLIDKPVINTDNTIIGGHQRIAVIRQSGVTEIECWTPSRTLTDREVDELNIRLNRNTGEWDWDILANEWSDEDLCAWGFREGEIGIVYDTDSGSVTDQIDINPTPITQTGDIYKLGDHCLVCGDSTSQQSVDACLDGQRPIIMITDPPYGVDYDPSWRIPHNTRKDGTNRAALGLVKNDTKINWAEVWAKFPGDIAYVWHASLFTSVVQQSLECSGFKMINQIVWGKQHFALSRGDYHWQHEPCWYAVRSGKKHNWQGARDQSTIWEISNLNTFVASTDDERTDHSTQKPLECMSRPLRNNTAVGDRVYDPFLGSGTTLLAAEQLGRICHAIELDPKYCDMAVRRWLMYRQQKGLPGEIIRNGRVIDDFTERKT